MKPRVRPHAWVLAGVLVTVPLLIGQNGTGSGAINDGNGSPSEIPDVIAYRMVMMSLSLPENPTPADTLKRDIRIKRIGLAQGDIQVLNQVISSFSREYGQWVASTSGELRSAPTVASAKSAVSGRDAIVNKYRSILSARLTLSGLNSFSRYVLGEKSKMYLPASPQE